MNISQARELHTSFVDSTRSVTELTVLMYILYYQQAVVVQALMAAISLYYYIVFSYLSIIYLLLK